MPTKQGSKSSSDSTNSLTIEPNYDPGVLVQYYIAFEEGLRPLHIERVSDIDEAYQNLFQMNQEKERHNASLDEEIVFMELHDA
jgi:hypothetical protein